MTIVGRFATPALAAAALLLGLAAHGAASAQAQSYAQGYAQGYGGYDRGEPDDGPPPRYRRDDPDAPPPRYDRRADPDDVPPPPRYRRADPDERDDDRPRFRRPPPDADDDRPRRRMVCVIDEDPGRRCRTRPDRPGSPCRCPGGFAGHREPAD